MSWSKDSEWTFLNDQEGRRDVSRGLQDPRRTEMLCGYKQNEETDPDAHGDRNFDPPGLIPGRLGVP